LRAQLLPKKALGVGTRGASGLGMKSALASLSDGLNQGDSLGLARMGDGGPAQSDPIHAGVLVVGVGGLRCGLTRREPGWHPGLRAGAILNEEPRRAASRDSHE
jgi:hypothetical protein